MHTAGDKTYNGDMVISPEEFSFASELLAGLGFTPMQLQDKWTRQNLLREYQDAYSGRTSAIKRGYAEAEQSGNRRKANQLRQEWIELQRKKKEAGFSTAPIGDLLKAGREKAKRERNVAGGVKFNSGNEGFVRDLARL